MNKKIILPISLMLLVGLAVFVSASYSASQKQITIPIKSGWNLIPAASWEIYDRTNSPMTTSEFKYIYYYLPIQNKYVLTQKDGETLRNPNSANGGWSNDPKEMEMAVKGSVWAYSEKDSELVLTWDSKNMNNDYFKLSSFSFVKGWNFIWIVPDMAEKTLNEIKGNCNIESFYLYNSGWTEDMANFLSDRRLDDDWIGSGAIIKVTNECTLGSGSGSVSPPTLPDGNAGEGCTDSDGGKDYSTKGITKGSYGNGQIFDVEDVCEDDEVHEYYCVSNSQDVTKPNYDWINYKCPNGCSNGACIQ